MGWGEEHTPQGDLGIGVLPRSEDIVARAELERAAKNLAEVVGGFLTIDKLEKDLKEAVDLYWTAYKRRYRL